MRETPHPIASEEIEPFAAMLVGRLFARCEYAKKSDPDSFEYHCQNLWHGLGGLEKIAIAAHTATHFSIAMNSHIIFVANYIEEALGVDPMKNKGWEW
jgi:hypothetical protein